MQKCIVIFLDKQNVFLKGLHEICSRYVNSASQLYLICRE